MDAEIQYIPKKLGIKLKTEDHGPALILFYEQIPNKGSPRRIKKCYRKRSMPIRGLTSTANSVPATATDLCIRHKKYLDNIPQLKIEKMLRIIQELLQNRNLETVLERINREFCLNPDEDLNVVDEFTLKRKKELMDEIFEKNRKKPGDSDFQYNVEVDFDQLEKIETNEWDSGSDDSKFFN